MSIEDVTNEEKKLKEEIDLIEEKTASHKEAAGEMLKFIITFSELVKRASTYYKYALDTEKKEIVTQVFTELTIDNKKLANYKAKEGFDVLFKRHDLISGRGAGTLSEPF